MKRWKKIMTDWQASRLLKKHDELSMNSTFLHMTISKYERRSRSRAGSAPIPTILPRFSNYYISPLQSPLLSLTAAAADFNDCDTTEKNIKTIASTTSTQSPTAMTLLAQRDLPTSWRTIESVTTKKTKKQEGRVGAHEQREGLRCVCDRVFGSSSYDVGRMRFSHCRSVMFVSVMRPSESDDSRVGIYICLAERG